MGVSQDWRGQKEKAAMTMRAWLRLWVALGAALMILGCATVENEVLPVKVDVKMDADEQYLLESGRLPGEL